MVIDKPNYVKIKRGYIVFLDLGIYLSEKHRLIIIILKEFNKNQNKTKKRKMGILDLLHN